MQLIKEYCNGTTKFMNNVNDCDNLLDEVKIHEHLICVGDGLYVDCNGKLKFTKSDDILDFEQYKYYFKK